MVPEVSHGSATGWQHSAGTNCLHSPASGPTLRDQPRTPMTGGGLMRAVPKVVAGLTSVGRLVFVAQANCARLLKVSGPKQWADAARTRKDIAASELKGVDIPFDETYALDDGTQRVEFRFLGHAHTPGDAVAYLPKHKILCTGDAC